MAKIYDFFTHQKKYDPHVIYVGDRVEWQDWDGQSYINVVSSINFKPIFGTTFSEKMAAFPIWEKEDYSVELSDGFTVIASSVIRKVLPKEKHPISHPSYLFSGYPYV